MLHINLKDCEMPHISFEITNEAVKKCDFSGQNTNIIE